MTRCRGKRAHGRGAWSAMASSGAAVMYRRTANHCSTVSIVVVPSHPTNTPPTPNNHVQLLQQIAGLQHEHVETRARREGALKIIRACRHDLLYVINQHIYLGAHVHLGIVLLPELLYFTPSFGVLGSRRRLQISGPLTERKSSEY